MRAFWGVFVMGIERHNVLYDARSNPPQEGVSGDGRRRHWPQPTLDLVIMVCAFIEHTLFFGATVL
jgi:hypothetical protein